MEVIVLGWFWKNVLNWCALLIFCQSDLFVYKVLNYVDKDDLFHEKYTRKTLMQDITDLYKIYIRLLSS